MSEPFLGEIRVFAGNFAPRGWATCDGQLLSISQNTALFALLGTSFGGDGITSFGLPDLRGRVPIHQGQGGSLSSYSVGESAGSENVTVLTNQMPAHTHQASASTTNGDKGSPAGNVWAIGVDSVGTAGTSFTPTPNTSMSPQAIGAAGGSQPHENIQPYLCATFIIALEGIFPSRS